MSSVRILLLEDSDLDAELILEQLRRAALDFTLNRVTDRKSFAEALTRGGHDLILSDFILQGFNGSDALKLARETAPETPFIFISGVLGEEFAIESLKDGATDYVLKSRMNRLSTAVARALAEARERKELRQAQERLHLLVAELSHRVKNTLASVASIARMTLKRSRTMEEFQEAFLSRIQALSEAHTLLFQANWGDTDLRRIAERALRPFRDDLDGVSLDGAPLALPPKPALALTLMFHELATNAAKYGAFSREGGRVDIAWRRVVNGHGDEIELTWTEHGGPQVVAPERKGFGHTLIERSSQYELDGDATIRFPETGLEAQIRFPALGA